MRDGEHKVVAFDLAGAETGFPPSLHAEALAFARARAPERDDPRQRAARPRADRRCPRPRRPPHRPRRPPRPRHDARRRRPGGLRLGPLARYVLDHQIHLELAPTCNVQIGAVASVAEHPIGPFLRAGFSVGVNTDNRLMSGVMPSSELAAVAPRST